MSTVDLLSLQSSAIETSYSNKSDVFLYTRHEQKIIPFKILSKGKVLGISLTNVQFLCSENHNTHNGKIVVYGL
jgi:hypothetical protein